MMNLNLFKTYLNKILIFYSPDRAGYWNSITRCSISEKPVQLGRYYLDFSSKIDYPGEFSIEGVPLYSFRNQPPIEHPIHIAQYAFGLYEFLYRIEFKEGVLLKKFIKIAEWFHLNKINVKDGKSWYIYNQYPEYNLNYPWISAMAQGQAISVLTRAAALTNDSCFEKLSEEALVPFEYEVKDGGLVNYFYSIPVYEEFTTPIKTMAVLNGFIFALFGIYDLILLNGNKKAHHIFKTGVDSLKRILPYYDFNHWTQYFLFDYPKKYYSSFTYHNLVAEQLKVMFFLTGEIQFMDYYKKWIKYTRSFVKKSIALINKLTYSNKLIP